MFNPLDIATANKNSLPRAENELLKHFGGNETDCALIRDTFQHLKDHASKVITACEACPLQKNHDHTNA